MKLLNRIVLIALFALVCKGSLAQVPERPANASPVVDLAHIINNDSLVNALNAELDTLSKQTQNQIVVVTVDDLGGMDAKEFATQLGQKWGVGGKALNNGFVMLVKPRNDKGDGEIGFATGYGLEGVLPDVFCKRLQTEYMIPHFKDGDYAAGIKAAIAEIVPVVLDEYSKSQAQARASEGSKKKGGTGNGWLYLAGILGLGALFVALRRRSKGAIGAQAPQASQLASDDKPKTEEPEKKEELESDDTDNTDDDTTDDESKPDEEEKPYKYEYGGGEFGGGGASTKF